jgi:hypothetical protein
MIGAMFATESVRRETLLDTVGATVRALLLYWFAHSYATTLGTSSDRRPRLRSVTFRSDVPHGP